ncbi:uncharacterized protein LOC143282218 [Babylonia areolata]|uniref:uncharacterized protein LOC143282218 n=1 Tax=Babylonia areolata TaxID=304850 RepID=UPI003FD2045C
MSNVKRAFLGFWLFFIFRQSPAESGQLVIPRHLAVLADEEGGDWNSGRELCHGVNMSLATVDRHAFFFLLSQSFLSQFQRYAHKHFWIGLYHVDREEEGVGGEYLWEADCGQVGVSDVFWGDDQPADSQKALCVLADNVTLRWRTDVCSARHHVLCQKEEDSCQYQRTRHTCTLYITASDRFSLQHGTPQQCQLLCDTTLKKSLPCWGFTMTSAGCVLHYQSTQPHCDVNHFPSTAYFRTCFRLSYMDVPFNRIPSNTTLPRVPLCQRLNNLSSDAFTSPPVPTRERSSPTPIVSTAGPGPLGPSTSTAPKETELVTHTSLPSSPPSTEVHESSGPTPQPSAASTATTTAAAAAVAAAGAAVPRTVVTQTASPASHSVLTSDVPIRPLTSKVVPTPLTSKVVPTPLTSKVVPTPLTSKVVPTPLTSKVVPTPLTSKVVPTPLTSKVVPTPLTSKVVPTPLTSKVVPTPLTSKVVPTPLTSKVTPDSPAPMTQPSTIPDPPVAARHKHSARAQQCTCRCDVAARRNKTAALREAEVTKRKLRMDVATLSSTRRKKCSASDDRASSRGIAYVGMGFVAVVASWIVLPDLVSLLYHVVHGVSAPGHTETTRTDP